MLHGLAGKVAVLTGAGSGLGWECMRIAAKAGMHLVLVDVQADALEQAKQAAQGWGAASVMAQVVNVADGAAMQNLADQVQAAYGAPHFVLNNAGVAAGGLLWEQSVHDWEWVLGVNLWGVIHGVRLFTPMMLRAAQQEPHWQGHIVNTASMAGLVNVPNMGSYNVSKHAVVSLTETLYQDLALVTEQVHCSVLCPYFVPTGIADSARNRPLAVNAAEVTLSQQLAQRMNRKAVQSGKVTAEDVASKVFAAVADNQFYIFSHPQSLSGVQTRMEDILELRNPSDPFQARPELGAALHQALKNNGAAA